MDHLPAVGPVTVATVAFANEQRAAYLDIADRGVGRLGVVERGSWGWFDLGSDPATGLTSDELIYGALPVSRRWTC